MRGNPHIISRGLGVLRPCILVVRGLSNPYFFTGIFYANLISQSESRKLYTLWSVIE